MHPLVTVHWDDPAHTTLRFDLATGWTWEAFIAARSQSEHMIAATAHNEQIDVIINAMGVVAIPQDMLVRPRTILADAHPRIGQFVIVLNNRLGYFSFRLLAQMDPTRSFNKWGMAQNLEEARTFMAGRRQTRDILRE